MILSDVDCELWSIIFYLDLGSAPSAFPICAMNSLNIGAYFWNLPLNWTLFLLLAGLKLFAYASKSFEWEWSAPESGFVQYLLLLSPEFSTSDLHCKLSKLVKNRPVFLRVYWSEIVFCFVFYVYNWLM